MNKQPKYRWPLNKDQLTVLQLLYRFRFASSDLVAQYFGKKNGTFVYNRLKVLQEQEYIGKRFDGMRRIQGKPAIYYLLPAGAKKLSDLDKGTNYDRNLYRETAVSEDFAEHCLAIFAICNYLKAFYGTRLTFSTKTDLIGFDYFPKQLPDAFVRLTTENGERYFFLDLYRNSQPFFKAVRKVKGYIDYRGSGKWSVTKAASPVILSICETQALQKRLQKCILASLKASWQDDVVFGVTTEEFVDNDQEIVWWLSVDQETRCSLEQM